MRFHAPVIVLSLFALAACGEDQTAQAPAPAPTSPPAATSPATPPPAATAPAVTSPQTAGGTQATPPAGSNQMAATPAATGPQAFHGRELAGGPVSLQLNADNTFVMNEAEGNRRVEGRYAFRDGAITFSDPKGDVGPATFPMRCRFEADADQFRLLDSDGSCERLKGLTFTDSAG